MLLGRAAAKEHPHQKTQEPVPVGAGDGVSPQDSAHGLGVERRGGDHIRDAGRDRQGIARDRMEQSRAQADRHRTRAVRLPEPARVVGKGDRQDAAFAPDLMPAPASIPRIASDGGGHHVLLQIRPVAVARIFDQESRGRERKPGGPWARSSMTIRASGCASATVRATSPLARPAPAKSRSTLISRRVPP